MAAKGQGRQDPDAVASRKRRMWLPLVLAGVLGMVLMLVVTAPTQDKRTRDDVLGEEVKTASTDTGAESSSADVPADSTTPDVAEAPTPEVPLADASKPAPTEVEGSASTSGLKVRLVEVQAPEPALPTLGSFDDPDRNRMQVSFTRVGGGISQIVFSDIWTTAAARRQAQSHWRAVMAGAANPPPLPGDDMRYVLAREQLLPAGRGQFNEYPILAARAISINGVELNLQHQAFWAPMGPGAFKALVENEAGDPVLEIERRFTLDGWSLEFEQRLTSHSSKPLDIAWSQIGPPGLSLDPGSYMDRRRFRFGYLLGQEDDPNRLAGVVADGALKVEFSEAVDEDEASTLWPNPLAQEEGWELSWFGSSSRYFGFVVYPSNVDKGGDHLSMEPDIERITRVFDEVNGESQVVTVLFSPTHTLESGEVLDTSLSAFAGPLKRELLEDMAPYDTLRFGGLVLYRMSDFCACCTFQWLAVFLVQILSFFDHWVVFDWGLSIILLVLCVRTLLHPITKRSQMGMQIFSKKMTKLKPEMDKIQKKYKDDRKKMQTEQMRLFREHGVNPLQMLGCLPLFLQTPIWIALWAALYFAFDLRQEPAFYGFFQLFAGWPFLGDLAQPDHCFWTFEKPFRLVIFDVSGINLLPFLLGGIFWMQQKYLTPKSASMTPEQETQQKIMRIMMVVLFPIMLYSAPSGLLLYIITSSCIGIAESRFIRKKVDAMDFDTLVPAKAGAARGGKDAQSRAYQKALDRRKQDSQRKRRGPDRKFKKRK